MSTKDYYIHTGSWVNHDYTTFLGGRITMTSEHGDLLNVFTGIFLVFFEAGVWTVLTFLAFYLTRHWRKGEYQDALHHQTQTVLRNSGQDVSIAVEYFELFRTWKSHLGTGRAACRLLPMSIFALLSFLFFLVALPFLVAEKLINHDNQFLMRSDKCGFWDFDSTSQNPAVYAIPELESNRTHQAINYADNCYESDDPSLLCDGYLISRKIPWNAYEVDCPFASDMCLAGAYMMETPPIDSHVHLGINAAPRDRMTFARRATCAPLNLAGRYEYTTDPATKAQTFSIFLGNYSLSPLDNGATFSTSVVKFNMSLTHSAPQDYYLMGIIAQTFQGQITTDSAYVPIPQLPVGHADLSLMILVNEGVMVASQDSGGCTDPFFSATQRCGALGDIFYCYPDSPVTVIGCLEQFQMIDPVSGWETAWGSTADFMSIPLLQQQEERDSLTAGQVAAMETVTWVNNVWSNMWFLPIIVGGDALRAKKQPGMFYGTQNPLPDNQWKVEVGYWFDTLLAGVQLSAVEVITGPPDVSVPGLINVLEPWATRAEQQLSGGANVSNSSSAVRDLVDTICRSQKIHDSTAFTNFNRSGFIALAAVGAFFIVVPPVLLMIAAHTRSALVWNTYGKQELLRLAAEGSKVGGWEQCYDEVPTTDTGRWKVYIPANEPEHPVFEKEGGVSPSSP